MAYIGNPIYQSAFVTDTFSGDGTTTAFTMSVAPAGTSNVLVAVSGVLQDPATYGVVGTTLNFTSAPPSGTGNISCRYLGVPVTGVTTTAYRTVTEFTATASQTTFTPPSYTVGFINVYRNGVLLGSADYTATNGTTVVLATGATAGDLVTVESFQVSSVVNAIQNTAGSVSSSNIATGAVTPAKLSTGGPYWDTSSNFGIGTTSPTGKLHVAGAGGVTGSSNLLYVNVTSSYGGISVNSTANNNSFVELLEAGTKVGGFNADTSSNVTSLQSDGGHALAFNTGGTTERGRFDTSGNFLFNSGYGSVATAYGCRAWVNFNGTGTVAIRASGNVSSITDSGTGKYQVNFTSALVDSNYSVSVVSNGAWSGSAHTVAYFGDGSQDFAGYVPPAPTTSNFNIVVANPTNGGSLADNSRMVCAVFR